LIPLERRTSRKKEKEMPHEKGERANSLKKVKKEGTSLSSLAGRNAVEVNRFFMGVVEGRGGKFLSLEERRREKDARLARREGKEKECFVPPSSNDLTISLRQRHGGRSRGVSEKEKTSR